MRRCGLVALAIGAFLASFNGPKLFGGPTSADVFFGIAALFLLIKFAVRPGDEIVSRVGLGAFGLVFISVLLSTFVAIDPSASYMNGLRLVISAFILPWMFVRLTDGAISSVRWLTVLWVGGVATNASIAISDFFGFTTVGTILQLDSYLARGSGLSIHPNHLAVACGMGLPVLAYFAMYVSEWRYRLLAWIAFGLTLMGMALSGSRGAIVAFLIVAAVGLCIGGRAAVRRALFGAVASALTSVLLVAVIWKSSDVADTFDSPGAVIGVGVLRLLGRVDIGDSDVDRMNRYSTIANSVDSSPILGRGYDNLLFGHSVPLQLLEASGVIGIVLGLIGVAAIAFTVLSRLSYLDVLRKQYVMAIGLGIGVWILMSVTQNFLLDRFLYVPVGLLLASALGGADCDAKRARCAGILRADKLA